MFKGMYGALNKLLGRGMPGAQSASLGGGLLRPAGMASKGIADMTSSAVPSGAATMAMGSSISMGRGFQMAARTNPVSFAQTNSLGTKLATHLDTIGGNMFRNSPARMGGGMQYGPMSGSYQKTSMGTFFPSTFSVSGTGYFTKGMGRMMGGLPNQMF